MSMLLWRRRIHRPSLLMLMLLWRRSSVHSMHLPISLVPLLLLRRRLRQYVCHHPPCHIDVGLLAADDDRGLPRGAIIRSNITTILVSPLLLLLLLIFLRTGQVLPHLDAAAATGLDVLDRGALLADDPPDVPMRTGEGYRTRCRWWRTCART